MLRPVSDFAVLTFDCYGTLIDWESGIWDAAQPLLMANDCGTVSRAAFLANFAREETAAQSATPLARYPDILRRTHQAIAASLGLRTTAALDGAFGESVPHWPAFPDTADALRRLKKRFRLIILSNVDRNGFAASSRKLGVTFDAVYTAEDIGSYKPDPRNFTYMLAHLMRDFGVETKDILHTAQSLHHDHVEAARLGLATAWIDRQRLSEGDYWGATAVVAERPTTDFRFFSLQAMAEAADTAP